MGSNSTSIAKGSTSASTVCASAAYYSGCPVAAGVLASGASVSGSYVAGKYYRDAYPNGSLSSKKNRICGATPNEEHDRETMGFLKWLEENHGEGKFEVKVYSRPVGEDFLNSLVNHHSIVIQYKKGAYVVIEWAKDGLSVNENKKDKEKVVGTCIIHN